MRPWQAIFAIGTLAFAGAGASTPADAQCSVFQRRPCMPSNCSVYQRRPCIPEFGYPIGEDLRVTIESASVEPQLIGKTDRNDEGADYKLNTIRALFDALRACWVPPPRDAARAGTQMSVRLSFKRSGEIIGKPRVTYVTPGTEIDVRGHYETAIKEALDRCTPMPFTAGLGGAIAGRPIAIRFVDNRKLTNQTTGQP